MARVKTFANAGSWTAVDLNAIQDAYEPLLAVPRFVCEADGNLPASAAAATRLLVRGSAGQASISSVPVRADTAAFYLDPADFAAGTRTVKALMCGRISVSAATNATQLSIGLHPVNAYGGGGAVLQAGGTIATLGTAVATLPFTGTAITSSNNYTGADFTFPPAGFYVFSFINTAAVGAANAYSVSVSLFAKAI